VRDGRVCGVTYPVDMDGSWRDVELPGGVRFPVRQGSPLDAAFTGSEPQVPMRWSLGLLGDLMWSRLPETRQFIAEQLIREIEGALETGRGLLPVLVGSLVPDALWHPVMRPALDDYPASRDSVAEQLQVVYEAYLAEDPDQAATRYALVHYVFGWLQEPAYQRIVDELHPELAALINQVMAS
jgi:hypothetical protein